MDADKRHEIMQESRFNLASLNSLSYEELLTIINSSEDKELTLFYSLEGKMQDCKVRNVEIDHTANNELQFITFDSDDPIASNAIYVKQTYGIVWFMVDYSL